MSLLSEISGIASHLLDGVPIIRAIIGFGLVFFVPGFAWTLVFFRGKQLNVAERIAISFGLSIALVTVSILSLNILFKISVTGLNSVLIIILITIIPVAIYLFNILLLRNQDKFHSPTSEATSKTSGREEKL